MSSFQIKNTKSELKDIIYFDPDKTRTCKNVLGIFKKNK